MWLVAKALVLHGVRGGCSATSGPGLSRNEVVASVEEGQKQTDFSESVVVMQSREREREREREIY